MLPKRDEFPDIIAYNVQKLVGPGMKKQKGAYVFFIEEK